MKAEKQKQNITAVIYARFSSHGQNEASIEQQVEECTLYAQRNGIRVLDVYEDKHKTGTSDRRPSFQRMLRHAERGEFDAVIAWKSNRIGRNMLQSLTNEAKLNSLGVRVLYAREEYGDDAAGRFALRTMMNVNQYFSDSLAEDVVRGMRDNARQGKANGRPPYGYRRGSDGRFELDPVRAPVVKRIFDGVQRGERISDIAGELNREGIRTGYDRPWTASSFSRLLDNERYTGVYIYDDVRIEGGMPAIITREEYNEVQRLLGRRKRGGRAAINGEYLLTGKLFCGCCGAPMVGKSGTGKSGRTYEYYVCSAQLKRACKKKPVRRDVLERRVAELARELSLEDETVEWIADKAVEVRRKNDGQNARAAELRADLRETETAIQNVMKAIEAGIFTETTKDRLQELERTRAELRDRLDVLAIKRPKVSREEIIYTLERFRGGDINDAAYRHYVIEAFVDAVYVSDEEIRIDLRYLPGGKARAYRAALDGSGEPSGVRTDSPLVCQNQPMRTLRGRLRVCVWENVVSITAKIKG